MSGQPVLVGAFARSGDAEGVLRALRVSGISPRRIGLAQRTGEILETVGLLAEADVPEHDVGGALIGLGVPVQTARDYQSVLERGWAIVTAQPQSAQLREATVTFQSGGVSTLCVCAPGARPAYWVPG
jgi:hypothetical protein